MQKYMMMIDEPVVAGCMALCTANGWFKQAIRAGKVRFATF